MPSPFGNAPSSTADFLSAGGEMGRLLRTYRWSDSPLGPPEDWPQPLKTLVSVMLTANQPMFLAWGSERTLLYNDPYSEILGNKHPSALGRDFLEVWSEIRADLTPIVATAYAGEPIHMDDIELWMERKGHREETHFAFSYTPVRDEAGLVSGFFCPCIEITQQVLSERRRAADAERQRQLFEQAPGFIAILASPEHSFEFANAAYRRLVGDRNIVGKTVRDALPELEGQGFFELLDRVYASGERFVADSSVVRIERSPGQPPEERFLNFIYEPVIDEDGRVTGIFVEGHDVTAAHRAEADLRASEARYRTLFDSVDAGFSVVELLFDEDDHPLDYRFVEANPAFARQTGLVDVVGRTARELVPNLEDHWFELYGRVARTGEPVRFEQGSVSMGRWFDVHALRVGDPKARRVAILFNDISERRAGEERLRELNDTLESRVVERTAELERAHEQLRQSQKLEAMGQLTGGVAHDFNNLLTPIVGSLDLLHRKGVGGERERRQIDGALQSAERARVLVQRLLAFARRQPLQTQAVDVRVLVEGMADLVASTSGPRVKLEIHVSDELPPARADANQVEMAILNLAVNARDAMPEGGKLSISASPVTVEFGERSSVTPGRYISLSVADTGAGMDEATLKRAIEPFFSTKGVGRGTGLGLSMVHGLAAQLGGELTISSKPALGTCVELLLPASDETAQPVGRQENVESQAAAGTVLLVDDEDLVRSSTADMLTELGYAVVEAVSAEEALRLVDSGLKPDLLVTDHLMPGLTGTDLAHELRTRFRALPVLLVSGYAEAEGVAPELVRLVKPFRQADLAAKLREVDDEVVASDARGTTRP